MNEKEKFYKEQYTILHEKNFHNFSGYQSLIVNEYVKEIINFFNLKTILDYGCGKAGQYIEEKIHKDWNIDKLYLYDIGVVEFSIKPNKNLKFDAVFCFDVLEHIRENDLEYFLDEIISYSKNIVVATISTREARKTLPNGENAHLTVKPKEWWNNFIINLYNKNSYKQKLLVLYENHSEKNFKNVSEFFINFSDEERLKFKEKTKKYL